MQESDVVPIEQPEETKPCSFPTKEVEGDFITLCQLAKDGEQNAVAALWKQLYPVVEDRLHFVDPIDRERFATEFLDRYLIGWVKPDNARGPKSDQKTVPPWIQDCTYNFVGFFHVKLANFLGDRIGHYNKPPMEEYREEDDNGDEGTEDFQNLADTGDLPGSLPRPEVEQEYNELLERCREALLKRYTPDSRIVSVFDMMLDEERQLKMATALNVDTSTIERDVAEIRRIMREIINV
jgi:hypothetical protein